MQEASQFFSACLQTAKSFRSCVEHGVIHARAACRADWQSEDNGLTLHAVRAAWIRSLQPCRQVTFVCSAVALHNFSVASHWALQTGSTGAGHVVGNTGQAALQASSWALHAASAVR